MAFFVNREKPFTKKWFLSYSLIITGSFILATAFVFFITPYKIVPGGAYGISIVLHYILGTPVGLMALCFDIPLTIIGMKILGPRFGFKTVLGFSLTAVFTDTLTFIWGFEPLVKGDALLSSIFGGFLCGLGLGLIFKSKPLFTDKSRDGNPTTLACKSGIKDHIGEHIVGYRTVLLSFAITTPYHKKNHKCNINILAEWLYREYMCLHQIPVVTGINFKR